MQAPFILWDNILGDSTTLTASTAVTGYSVDNLVDYRTHTFWAGSGATTYTISIDLGASSDREANTIGVAAHNLYSIGSTLYIESSSDGASWVGRATVSCTSDDPHISTFAAVTARHWRARINCQATSQPTIGVLSIGTHLNFPTPPIIGTSPMDQGIEAVSNHSQAGILLGNIIKYHPMESNLAFAYVPTSFFRDATGAPANYGVFWRSHGKYLRPFFIAFSQDTYPEHRYYMRLSEKQTYSQPLFDATMVQNLTLRLISCLEATT